ncbi:glycosyltransferase family 2 protein [Planctomycetaceae bacterium SH139]
MVTKSPLVSIIVPTFNRAAMLAEGLESIRNQSFSDWEVIVVDDGSTDVNRKVVESFGKQSSQPVKYFYQKNQGAGVARQRAIDESCGEILAFMDSDDPWLSHHLTDCVEALLAYNDIDWVVGPARVVNDLTGAVVHESSFVPDGRPRPLFELNATRRGQLAVIDDPGFVEHVIVKGFPGGLQTSVLRRWVIEKVRIRPYRLFDDIAFQLEAAGHGVRVGYFQEPHIIYRIHSQNVSLVGDGSQSYEKRCKVYADGVNVLRELAQEPVFSQSQRSLIFQKQSDMLFWDLGYQTYWQNGCRVRAFQAFCSGLYLTPWDRRKWKTLAASIVRLMLRRAPAAGRN